MDTSSDSMYKRPIFIFLMVLTAASAFGLQAWRALFNNFGVEVAGINALEVGIIQSAREIPGFLSFLVAYILLFMKESRLSVFSVIMMGIGIGLTGFLPSFWGLLLTTFIMSLGFHYYETTNQSLTLQYFSLSEAPYVYGKIRSITALTNLLAAGVVFVMSFFMGYSTMYLILGLMVLAAGYYGLRYLHFPDEGFPQQKKLLFRKDYWLFYLLTFLAGARRQIFVVFSLFLMVKIVGFSVQEITFLFVINNIVAFFANPMIGKAIDQLGERKVLTLEYFSIILIFIFYVHTSSKWVVSILYILDNLFFNFSFAIRTFFQKIARKEDIAASTAVGFTINHIAAVFIPVLGGLLWSIDYKIAFYFGALLGFFSLVFVQFVDHNVRKASLQKQTNMSSNQ